jgi:hypothetical protein
MNTLTPTSPERSFEDRLLDELLTVQAEMEVPAPAPARRRWGRAFALTGVAAAIAAAVVLQALPGSVNSLQPASAAAELQKLSAVVSSIPAETLAPGQYLYTESVSNSGGPVHVLSPVYNVEYDETRQFWVAPDGSGHGVFTFSNVTFPTAQDQAAWVAQGSPDLVSLMSGASTFGPGNYGPMKVDEFTLPTDQAQLSQIIASLITGVTSAQPGTTEYSMVEFDYIGLLLQETAAPPDVRAALLTLAESIPGITLIGPTTAPEGVSGVGIVTPSPTGGGSSRELIFNPTTGTLIAQEQWLTDSSGAKTLERWTSYIASGVVDNTSTTIPVSTPSSAATTSS